MTEFIDEEVLTFEDVDEFYILGIPIKTRIGDCHFLKVEEYPILFTDLQVVALTKLHFINELYDKNNEQNDLLEQVEKMSLMEIVLGFKEITDTYIKVFAQFFKDSEAFFYIKDEKEFEYLRGLILKMSCIREEKINPNPEIQRAIERSRRVKSLESEKMTFSDIVTSVSVFKGVNYNEINKMTLFQLYMDFHRIAKIIGYQTSTLFATVPTEEKTKIESWSGHIDLFEEEKFGLSREEFSKISGVIQDKK